MKAFLPYHLEFFSDRLDFDPYTADDVAPVAREMREGGPAVDLALEGIREGFGLDLRQDSDVVRFFEVLARDWELGEHYVFPMRLRGDQTIVGELWVEDRGGGELEIGYFLWERFQGNGYATEAVRATSELLFRLGALRVHIECDQTNQASAAVALRSGFRLNRTTTAADEPEKGLARCYFDRVPAAV